MIKRKTAVTIRKTHRYLGLFIGLQFLAWTLSGLYFSWTDIDEIHGDPFLKTEQVVFSYPQLFPLDSIPESIQKLELVRIGSNPYYWINESTLYDAINGTPKSLISEEEALEVAQQNLIDGLQFNKIELLEETDPHHEYRGRPLPAYAIHFEHPDLLIAYVDAKSGQFQRIRHESWRWFDFLWMSHTMDYQGRDDFNNVLLRIFSLFGLFTVMSGFLLWATSSPTLRKLK
ncbi:MAG: hypothetical protein VW080_00980 [Flavobacteriaceae bacterium]